MSNEGPVTINGRTMVRRGSAVYAGDLKVGSVCTVTLLEPEEVARIKREMATMVRLRVVNLVTEEECADLPGDQHAIAKQLADTLAAKLCQQHVVYQWAVVYKTKEEQHGAEQANT